jgi:hypothetical protein
MTVQLLVRYVHGRRSFGQDSRYAPAMTCGSGTDQARIRRCGRLRKDSLGYEEIKRRSTRTTKVPVVLISTLVACRCVPNW